MNPSALTLNTREPEEFAETMQPVTPGVCIRATNKTFQAEVSVAPLARAGLFRATGTSMHVMLPGNQNLFTLTIPTRAGITVGRERSDYVLSGANAHVLAPKIPFDFRFSEPADVLVASLTPPLLDTFIRRLNADLSGFEPSDKQILSLASPAGAMLKRYLDYLWHESVHEHLWTFPEAVRSAEDTLMTMIALALDTEDASVLIASKSVPVTALRRAEQFISEHFTEPLSLVDITRAAGLPVRSLTRGFRDRYGYSPMEYVRKCRLEAAHSVLESSDRVETTVTSVAFGVGFNHVGRFTAAYFAHYGKYPSETLARPSR